MELNYYLEKIGTTKSKVIVMYTSIMVRKIYIFMSKKDIFNISRCT